MASVTLKTAWLNLASDPSQFVVLQFATAIKPQPLNPQTDRMYGGSRFRAVSAGAIQQTVAVAAVALAPDDVATLTTWNGQMIWYRDDSGMKFAGTYANLTVTRHQYDENADVTFTVTEKTFTEAV